MTTQDDLIKRDEERFHGWWIGVECDDTMSEYNHKMYWLAHVLTTIPKGMNKRQTRDDRPFNRKAFNNCKGIVFW